MSFSFFVSYPWLEKYSYTKVIIFLLFCIQVDILFIGQILTSLKNQLKLSHFVRGAHSK